MQFARILPLFILKTFAEGGRMIVLVDQDGPLAHFEELFLQRWQRTYPAEVSVPLEKRTNFKLVDDYPPALHGRIRQLYTSKGFYQNLPVVPGAIEALRQMQEAGHEVWICTPPLRTFRFCVPEKFDWVLEHLGPRWTERIIMVRDKTLVHGDILIDDRPEVTGSRPPSWEHVIFDAPYNRTVADRRRMKADWSNWREILREKARS